MCSSNMQHMQHLMRRLPVDTCGQSAGHARHDARDGSRGGCRRCRRSVRPVESLARALSYRRVVRIDRHAVRDSVEQLVAHHLARRVRRQVDRKEACAGQRESTQSVPLEPRPSVPAWLTCVRYGQVHVGTTCSLGKPRDLEVLCEVSGVRRQPRATPITMGSSIALDTTWRQ